MNYRITPIDPLISRDARSFGAGSPMHTLNWLSQTLVAGTIRTTMYKAGENLEAIKQIKIRGSFPLLNDEIYFPRPLDIVKSSSSIYQVKPMKEWPSDSGANMPLDGLMPSQPDADEDFKPEKLNAFWKRELMIKWLNNGKKDFTLNDNDTLTTPSQDERVHACINPSTGISQDGNLFSTTGLDFIRRDETNKTFTNGQISLDIEAELPERFTAALGGERRLADFTRSDNDNTLWEYPSELPEKFDNNFRLILATPAIFSKGWLPDWINENDLTGTIPNTNAKVKLVSAVTERWLPVSGWGYERGQTGHKPMRRAVPSGSVYFFDVIEGTLTAKNLWLNSICCKEQDINDGFGLVLIGRGE